MTKLTKEEARAIVEAHDISLDDEEESELLQLQNTNLYYAYIAILQIANGK